MPYLLTANPGSPTSWVKMETESVLSGHSEFSNHRVSTTTRSGRTLPPLSAKAPPGSYSNYAVPPGHGHRFNNASEVANNPINQTMPDLTTVGNVSTPPLTSPILSNYSLNKNINHLNLNFLPRNNSNFSNTQFNKLESPIYQTTVSMPVNDHVTRHHRRDPNSERIEVQILSQENDWGDNTTTVTGFSDLAFPSEGLLGEKRWNHFQQDDNYYHSYEEGWRFACQRLGGFWISGSLSLLAFLSPILMVILPKTGLLSFRESQLRCEVECDGSLIGFSFKLLVLLLGSWALFLRSPKATLPRIHLYRACVCLLIFIFIFSFWLFYGVRVLETQRRRRIQYYDIVLYANSMVDALLFVHYLALIFMEIKHLSPRHYIKIVRSPDGESRSYSIGELSIQRAAAWILEKYYTDFSVFNPYLEKLPYQYYNYNKGGEASPIGNAKKNFKYYDVEGLSTIHEKDPHDHHCRKESSAHNERFYEEYEYDRRLKKRRARLITATEDAFAHIKRQEDFQPKNASNPMDPYEAAQAIFPSLARPLQKYLRITRQQPRHTMESILNHLSTCLKYDMSPKAFLEKYIVTSPVLQSDREDKPVQSWALICDALLSRSIGPGTIFQLRQGDVSLLCEVSRLPHFNISEEVSFSNSFHIKLNSETPV